jgi:hypothetical protein
VPLGPKSILFIKRFHHNLSVNKLTATNSIEYAEVEACPDGNDNLKLKE